MLRSRLLETFTFNLGFNIPSGNTSQLKNVFPEPLVSFLTFHLSYYALFRGGKWQLVSLKAMDTLFVNETSAGRRPLLIWKQNSPQTAVGANRPPRQPLAAEDAGDCPAVGAGCCVRGGCCGRTGACSGGGEAARDPAKSASVNAARPEGQPSPEHLRLKKSPAVKAHLNSYNRAVT